MQPIPKSVWCVSLVGIVLAVLAPFASAGDPFGLPASVDVHVLLIIDRQAGVAGTNLTLGNILWLIEQMKGAGINVELDLFDSGVSPDGIKERLRRLNLGGHGALWVYYLGHHGCQT